MLSFTAIDFETANRHRSSACAIGAVKVVDGEVVHTFESLIRPPDRYGWFDDINISIHGITAEDVVHAPRWNALVDPLCQMAEGSFVVSHNSSFDNSVFRYACDEYAIPWPDLPSACTLQIARKVLSLDSYRLPKVARALGIPSFQHHRALADAQIAAAILVEIADRIGAATVEEVLEYTNVNPGNVGRVKASSYRVGQSVPKSIPV